MNENTTKAKYYQSPSKSKMKNPKREKVFDLRERIFNFSQRILDISEIFQKTEYNKSICIQLIKSGTSIGANMEEADGTLTKKDFLNKIVIARKEAKETRYWLKLISGRYIDKKILKQDIQEIQEIIYILTAIISKLKNT